MDLEKELDAEKVVAGVARVATIPGRMFWRLVSDAVEEATKGQEKSTVANACKAATTTTKSWTVPGASYSHDVQLRHNSVLNEKEVFIDGVSVFKNRPTSALDFASEETEIPFSIETIGALKYGQIKISFNLVYTYACTFDGQVLPEVMESKHIRTNIEIKVQVAGYVVEGDVVKYLLNARALDTKSTVRKRFSEIDELDSLIKNSFRNNHLYTNLPELPSKIFFGDKKSAEFCEGRVRDLNLYFNSLLRIPHMNANKELRQFLFPDIESRRSAFSQTVS